MQETGERPCHQIYAQLNYRRTWPKGAAFLLSFIAYTGESQPHARDAMGSELVMTFTGVICSACLFMMRLKCV